MGKPLAIDLCCGLGGWTEGLLAEGYRARGYDIEAHEYGDERYPGELVLKSILDLDGAECADADLIVASPPCTEYSYMAMPWSRAKQIARALRRVKRDPLHPVGRNPEIFSSAGDGFDHAAEHVVKIAEIVKRRAVEIAAQRLARLFGLGA